MKVKLYSCMACVVTLVLISGCGPKMPYEVVPLAGTITWQGEPVKSEHISISFVPEGEGRPSSAWLNADGTFEAVYSPQAKGVQVGKCTMRLTWLADVGGACPEELAPMFKKYGPASEGYQMDVQKGNRKIVIALE